MTSVVLLTGATGFVGRQVLKALLAQGDRVRLVVREGKENPVPNVAQIESVLNTPDFFSESTSWLDCACEGVDTVIHAAWYAEPERYLRSPYNLTCLRGTLALASSCIRKKVRRFVGVGSCFEYDVSTGYLSVNTPLKPTTPYAAAKAAAFLALSECLPIEDVEFAWCRLFYLYGEGEDQRRLVPYLRERLRQGQIAELTEGSQIRDYMDVAEAGKMIAEVANGDHQGAMNICSGTPITVRQLAEQMADEFGRRDLLHFGARPNNSVDPACVVGIK